MADKAVSELVAATQVTATDLFVLEQGGTAKKLTGQILENWLVSLANGHGGIQSIEKVSTSGLVDTYQITLADTTTFDFTVTNGKAISSVTQTATSGLTRTYTIAFNDSKNQTFTVTDGRSITSITHTSTSGLVDTYTINYNDGTSSTFTVTNGAKGDTGDNAYVWIKYASQEPVESSHDMSDLPDNWMGVYSGTLSEAPDDYTQYQWFQIKGEKGDTGDPATLESSKVEYIVGDSGTVIPSGSWTTSIPTVAQGKYLWTRTTVQFNTGSPIASYSVTRMGLDGTGSVSSVANVSPDESGNVPLTADDINALSKSGGEMEGSINMNGQKLNGLNAPAEDDEAANKAYVDTSAKNSAPFSLLDNGHFTNPVNQRGSSSYSAIGYCIDRWRIDTSNTSVTVEAGGVTIKRTGGTSNSVFKQLLPAEKTPATGEIVTVACEDADGNIYVGSGAMPESGYVKLASVGDMAVFYLYAADDTQNARLNLVLTAVGEITIKWIALYKGQYTTNTLPKYRPKGYGAELAECQRYYFAMSIVATGVAGIAIAPSSSYAIMPVAFPVKPVSGYPTITADTAQFTLRNAGETVGEISAFGSFNIAGSTLMLRITGSGFTAGGVCYVRATTQQVIEFSWEL